jgi:hypothetical protein
MQRVSPLSGRRDAFPAPPCRRLEHVDLARDLVVDGLLDEAERVDVLDLGARAEFFRPDRRTDTFASQRNEPSCMLPSQISR